MASRLLLEVDEMLAVDLIAGFLADRGVTHVFGVGGANIEDLFAAVQRRRPQLQAVLCKHEHAAGTAADAYARLSGGLGVVMTTSGGGAMNVVHALAEARAARVPVLAVIGEPPADLQGRGAFQDTSGRNGTVDAAAVFRAVSVFCARVSRPDDLGASLAAAATAATGATPGPAVLLLAKDLQRADVPAPAPRTRPTASRRPPVDAALVSRAAQLLGAGRVLVIAGDQVGREGAGADLARLVGLLDARVAVAPDARDAFDNADPRFVGVAGAMGHAAVAQALGSSDACLLVGTRLPLLARMGLEDQLARKPLIAVADEPPWIHSDRCLHLTGGLPESLRQLSAAVSRPAPSACWPDLPPVTRPAPGDSLTAAAVANAVSRSLPEGGVVLVDAGNTGAEAVHQVAVPKNGRWLLAMGMAGMGWTFGAAVGAACATRRRCTVLAGDGAFLMHGLDIHTAVQHRLPITYVIFNNRAHGMCVVRERLLLGGTAGYNTFEPAHLGAGLAVMFPGLPSTDCRTLAALEAALATAAAGDGPAVIGAELPEIEVPPFVAFRGHP